MRTEIVEITPALAKEWLEKNKKNRNISKRALAALVDVIKRGQWKLNGDAIRFDKNQNLLDGQHRLSAIAESGVTVKSLVVRDVETDAMQTIDIGNKRSHADHLALSGIQTNANTLIVAAAVRIAMMFSTGFYVSTKDNSLSPTDTIEFVKKNPGILHAEERTPAVLGKFMPRSVAVGLYYLFYKIHKERTEEFFQALALGESLSNGHPALTLRNALMLMTAEKSSRTTKRQIVAITCRAFDAFINNERINQLRYSPDKDIVLPSFKFAKQKESA